MTGEQLKEKLFKWGFTLADVAEKMAMSPQALQSKLDTKDVKVSFVIAIATAIKKSIYDVLDIPSEDKGFSRSGVVAEPLAEYGIGKKEVRKPIQGVPFYNVHATAGVIGLFSNRDKYVPIDHIHIPNMPKCDGALPITGDSMYPLLKSGDIVLYKEVKDKRNIIWGEMYLVAIVHHGDEFFFVKYIQKGDNDGHAKFVSQNSHHQPVEFPIDSISALGLIKASIRINSTF